MDEIIIQEIQSNQLSAYRKFILIGLIEDAEQFRISPDDDANCGFPTKNTVDSFTLGAYINNTLAGVVSFTRDGADREKLRHKGLLFRRYVHKDFRKRGIGKLLIHDLLTRVKAIGNIEQINLTVSAANQKAKALYESFGFKTFGHEVNSIKWNGRYFSEELMAIHFNAL